jgi:DNA polymerase/3'-5' exonuclease PolX
MQNSKASILKQLQSIPGVGESISNDLWILGIRSVEELRKRDPEKLYLRYNKIMGRKADRCLLYVFRCAIYYASHRKRDPELLYWWKWKD